MDKSLKLYATSFAEPRTYIAASLFIAGNIALPQLVHLVPNGGVTWLPIYFFTLIAAYQYGWRAGLLTALLSPLINSWLFQMPSAEALPSILLKSTLLAFAAAAAARHFKKVTIPALLIVVLAYQTLGTLGEWVLTQNLNAALQDFRIGVPGMALQVFGGYAVLKCLLR